MAKSGSFTVKLSFDTDNKGLNGFRTMLKFSRPAFCLYELLKKHETNKRNRKSPLMQV